jgi:hypothetical protein
VKAFSQMLLISVKELKRLSARVCHQYETAGLLLWQIVDEINGSDEGMGR